MSEIENYNSESHNIRYHQINQKAWLIWYDDGWGSNYGDFMVFLNCVEALEVLMALNEEEMYIGFVYMIDDEMEDRTVEEIANSIDLYDTMWHCREVPLYGTICC
jgi:hypothetical protein